MGAKLSGLGSALYDSKRREFLGRDGAGWGKNEETFDDDEMKILFFPSFFECLNRQIRHFLLLFLLGFGRFLLCNVSRVYVTFTTRCTTILFGIFTNGNTIESVNTWFVITKCFTSICYRFFLFQVSVFDLNLMLKKVSSMSQRRALQANQINMHRV